ncbi:MAG: VOC family protein [Novosphingobium sp.]
MAGDYVWYELITPDPQASKTFYGNVVGWTYSGSEHDGYFHLTTSDGEHAGGMAQLTAEMQARGARPVWLGYIHVTDVDAEVEAIEREGGRVQMPAIDLANVGRIAMVTDPQGAPFYVINPIPPADKPDAKSTAFSVDAAQHVRWNELSTSDADAAVAFYTGHFGWVQEGDLDMGEMGKYRFIHKDGIGLGAIMPKHPEMPASSWSYYIGVADIDLAAKAIEAGGGKIIMGPMEIPGGEFALNGIDPQGASFGLVGPRKE